MINYNKTSRPDNQNPRASVPSVPHVRRGREHGVHRAPAPQAPPARRAPARGQPREEHAAGPPAGRPAGPRRAAGNVWVTFGVVVGYL